MLRIGVLASHEGTTLQSVIDACAQGRINGRVVAVISNNSGSGALRRATAAGIETFLSSVPHSNGDFLDAAICGALQQVHADVVLLAGYMKRLGPLTLAALPARILNTYRLCFRDLGDRVCSGIACSRRCCLGRVGVRRVCESRGRRVRHRGRCPSGARPGPSTRHRRVPQSPRTSTRARSSRQDARHDREWGPGPLRGRRPIAR